MLEQGLDVVEVAVAGGATILSVSRLAIGVVLALETLLCPMIDIVDVDAGGARAGFQVDQDSRICCKESVAAVAFFVMGEMLLSMLREDALASSDVVLNTRRAPHHDQVVLRVELVATNAAPMMTFDSMLSTRNGIDEQPLTWATPFMDVGGCASGMLNQRLGLVEVPVAWHADEAVHIMVDAYLIRWGSHYGHHSLRGKREAGR